ncbi:uncharacterized protein MONBRDRAFT_9370 [Monosiga brevicollis MX1]|uniref:Threonylcarbamoyl-AMP synthase n=1 Tax=Monosiga brevicollis TaxID=81824 RepID=A9V2X9_MONBE|nr:uncharacterized protein MONBRDRAFT_9370 [Monosiga brevicollis MX1]EDQ88092.1 predicted protein [Monosiga brevicollis MX1]|eukprot:XP_001747168.1 hypothetical protein [Monosiga brevicollis MX1]
MAASTKVELAPVLTRVLARRLKHPNRAASGEVKPLADEEPLFELLPLPEKSPAECQSEGGKCQDGSAPAKTVKRPAVNAALIVRDHVVPALQREAVVALPTDTIYGIAAVAQSATAVQKLYDIKERDPAKPIAICVPKVADVYTYAHVTVPDDVLHQLLPGAVTVVFKRKPALNPLLNPDTDLIGIRVTNHSLTQAIVAGLQAPIALTSANKAGAASCVQADEFEHLWPALGCVVDGGRLGTGSRLGSTVVDLSKPQTFALLRDGDAEQHVVDVLTAAGWHREGDKTLEKRNDSTAPTTS